MKKRKLNAIIVSISSDIGTALAADMLSNKWNVFGTYRTKSIQINNLEKIGANLIPCDLSIPKSISSATETLSKVANEWDVIILCPGTQNPVGPFLKNNFSEWEQSIMVNFTRQLQIVHELMPYSSQKLPNGPCVIFFAGVELMLLISAYTLSKSP